MSSLSPAVSLERKVVVSLYAIVEAAAKRYRRMEVGPANEPHSSAIRRDGRALRHADRR
ncbi:hypothetical protein KHC28_16075 [Ancylobacter sonchi]|uniref:hypothetical protein n=1 Tax=Ancylobacter sonchi TaxID=1937790 RepID=UPI001BD32C0A|nr:hypothetical protein [Ancylobacter sonchi]MBS7535171.1 hypothetical protein [Ancylobacter sonchi]